MDVTEPARPCLNTPLPSLPPSRPHPLSPRLVLLLFNLCIPVVHSKHEALERGDRGAITNLLLRRGVGVDDVHDAQAGDGGLDE